MFSFDTIQIYRDIANTLVSYFTTQVLVSNDYADWCFLIKVYNNIQRKNRKNCKNGSHPQIRIDVGKLKISFNFLYKMQNLPASAIFNKITINVPKHACFVIKWPACIDFKIHIILYRKPLLLNNYQRSCESSQELKNT